MSTEAELQSLADETASSMPAPSSAARAATGAGAPASWSANHPLARHLDAMAAASGQARISMAIGELATTIDQGAGDEPAAVGVSAIRRGDKAGLTAISLAALWGKWGRPTCLIDLGSGRQGVGGALTATSPDLQDAVRQAENDGLVTGLAALHPRIPDSTVLAAGQAEVLGLLSTGALARLVRTLNKQFDRVVLAAPVVETGFPILGLYKCCDRLVLSLVRGKTRGGPVRKLAEQAMALGLRPLDAIWYD